VAECKHVRWVYPEPYVEDYGGYTTTVYPDPYTVSTYEDIVPGQGRFRCTQCGHIGYYTGLWRKFWEEGIPCPGSENIQRAVG
jgi:hypothetical protein